MRKIFNHSIIRNKKNDVSAFQSILDNKYGHSNSLEMKKSVDAQLNPIPWFTYPAIEFLSQFNYSELEIFEWGSGNSSFYFAQKCKSIISVEINNEWFDLNNDYKLKNQTFILSNEEKFESEILNFNSLFDIIIIDSIKRSECANIALNKIKENGLIILDNSDRHPEICKFIRDKGFTEIDFHGFGPINNYTWTSSLFFKSFSLKPLNIQPVIPIGGGY